MMTMTMTMMLVLQTIIRLRLSLRLRLLRVEPVVVRGASVGVQHDFARRRAFAEEDDFDGQIVSVLVVQKR